MNIRKKIRQMGWKQFIYSMVAGYLLLSIVFEFSAYHFISSSVDKGFSDIHSKMDKEQKFREEGYKEMDEIFADERLGRSLDGFKGVYENLDKLNQKKHIKQTKGELDGV